MCFITFLGFSDAFGQTVDFTTPGNGTWTCPAGVTQIRVEVIGAGGGVTAPSNNNSRGGGGGGGGGAVRNGNGGSAPVRISSTTTVHDKFFLLNEETNVEKDVSLQNWDVSLREGHIVQVIWAIAPGKDKGPYVVVNNKNLNKPVWSKSQIHMLTRSHYRKQFWGSLAITILISFIFESFLIFLILGIASVLWWSKKRTDVSRELESSIQKIVI